MSIKVKYSVIQKTQLPSISFMMIIAEFINFYQTDKQIRRKIIFNAFIDICFFNFQILQLCWALSVAATI